jgi:hypothetical protein
VAFNVQGLLRFGFRLLSRIGRPGFPWTARRIAILLAFLVVYPLLETAIWIGLLLDNALFRGFRQTEVRRPVFIVGNPRSGTTFLHRLMALDREQFTTMLMWQILFAPSITQRKLVSALAAVDRALGGPVQRLQSAIEGQWQEEVAMHAISLSAPEEDDYLLLHIFSALTTGLSAGVLEEAIPYTYFDTALPAADRHRIMGFYRRCVQRHLFASRGAEGVHYLAKNPALCPKLATVWEHFPQAKVVYLVRNPLEMVSSYVSMMHFSWRAIGDPTGGGEALRDYVIEMAKHWYDYPLEQLSERPKDSYVIVKYDDLVADPELTMDRICGRLGFELSEAYRETLAEAARAARRYQSRHRYSLEGTGLTREQIVAQFQEIFDRFGFDTGLPTTGDEASRAQTAEHRTTTAAREVHSHSAVSA